MKPTIGRVVHFHPQVAREHGDPDTLPLPLLTFAAIVADVVDGEAHLQVFQPGGQTWYCTYATYSDEPKPGCWSWPPRE